MPHYGVVQVKCTVFDPRKYCSKVKSDAALLTLAIIIVQEKVQIGCWTIQVCESGVRGVEWAG